MSSRNGLFPTSPDHRIDSLARASCLYRRAEGVAGYRASPERAELSEQALVSFLTRSFVIGLLCLSVAQGQTTEMRAVGQVETGKLNEISGIAYSRHNTGVVWLHDDGDIRDVYAVRTSGKLVARVRLPRKLEDAEDIALAAGPNGRSDFLYIGDIGDNDRHRASVRVIRFAEPDLSGDVSSRIDVDQVVEFRLHYPRIRHDAEALLVDPHTGDILIVTKHKSNTKVFVARKNDLNTSKTVQLTEMCRLPVVNVSAGDISRDGRRLLLRREEVGWLWEVRPGENLAAAVGRPPKSVAVRGPLQSPNGEAISFHPSGQAYVTVSEGKREWIYAFR